LMKDDRPVAGVVYAPAIDWLYYGSKGMGSFKRVGDGEPVAIRVDESFDAGIVAAQSRSHASPEEMEFLKQFSVVKTIQIGSSLKFCIIAEGKAHIYPRFGPMMEWDTAAGHAVVEEAGGIVRSWNGELLRYNTESLKHRGMIISSRAVNIRPAKRDEPSPEGRRASSISLDGTSSTGRVD